MAESQGERFDYVIVGGGSAGCVLASRLSENPAATVCLIEAGGPGDHWTINVPAGIMALLKDPQRNWLYETTPQSQLDNRQMFWPRGKALGGSSAINAMVYIRGHAADYDRWAQAENCPGWDWESVLPWFLKAENNERLDGPLHGRGGPLNVADPRSPNRLSTLFVEAAEQCQHPANDDFNGARQDGAGLYQLTQKDGNRCSAWHAYLAGISRPNLKVMTGTQACRVLFEGARAVGVECDRDGTRVQVACRGEVLLCGGAVNSPQLLQLSGIGDGERLARLGIQVRHDNASVGGNLQDHLDVSIVQHTPTRLGFGFTLKGLGMVFGALRDYRRGRRGLLTSNFAEAGVFARSTPDEPVPDLQYHFLPVMSDDHGRKRIYSHGVTLHCCDLRPLSRGRIDISSPDPLMPPRIDPNYLSDPRDMQKLKQGVAIGRHILSAPALQPHMGEEHYPGAAIQDDAALETFIRSKAETIYHPVGTCRMGSDADAVVDTEFRVRGAEGLRVVDASTMPSLIGGNTNAPVIMMAERAAAMILG